VSNTPTPSTGRLAGSKSASYVRAVNEPESRASRYTARYMLAGDIAYVLSAAELKCTPTVHARNLLQALLEMLSQLPDIDATADVVAQRGAWIQRVRRDAAASSWSIAAAYSAWMYFQQTLR
jgi:hypothetical protein